MSQTKIKYRVTSNPTHKIKHKSIKNIKDYTGGGFRDFARLAHSDALMWNDICLSNDKNVISSINMLIKELSFIKTMVKSNDKSLCLYLNRIKTKLDKK